MKRLYLALALAALMPSNSWSQSAPRPARGVCALPTLPSPVGIPGYKAFSSDTPDAYRACVGRGIDQLYATMEREARSFMAAQRRIYNGTVTILRLQNSVGCGPVLESYDALRQNQYTAFMRAQNEAMQEFMNSCADADAAPQTSAPQK